MPANLRPNQTLESSSSAPGRAKLGLSKKASSLWSALGTVSLLAVLALGASAHAELMGADERLEAIRNSLVQTALDGPTEVKSTMWVDKDGALHESNSFTSGMEVRGVRVLSYGRDANAGSANEGSSSAQLSTEGRKNLKPSACGKTTFADKLAVWHHMTLDIVLSSNMNANQKYRANQVMQDLRRNLLLTSAQSRLVHLADMTIPVSRYEQVLVG